MCDNKQKLEGYQARSFKSLTRNTSNAVQENEFMQDIQFASNGGRQIKKFERKQKIRDIKDQIDYFGYEIEPFHMKEERDIGNFDGGGYFVFDKQKDKTINDAWLDSLDQGNTFDKVKQDQNVSKQKIEDIDNMTDGFEKEAKCFGRETSDGYFKSRRFSTKQEADDYYRSLEDLDQKEEQEPDISQPEQEEEIDIQEDEQRRVKPKKIIQDEEHHDLMQFDPEQLKLILVDLLEEGENPNEAMRRLKEIFAPTIQKQSFKKNQRKQVRFEEPAPKQIEIDEGLRQESRLTFNMILDLCQTILSKTEDPEIFDRRKDRIVPVEIHDNMNDSTQYQTKVVSESDNLDIMEPLIIEDIKTQIEEGVIYDEKDEDNIF